MQKSKGANCSICGTYYPDVVSKDTDMVVCFICETKLIQGDFEDTFKQALTRHLLKHQKGVIN